MGADLYIASRHKANKRKHQKPFDDAVAERDRLCEAFAKRWGHVALIHRTGFSDEPVKIPTKWSKAQKADNEAIRNVQDRIEASLDALNAPDGYFRDSYNDSSVLNRIGLSWWKDASKYIDGDGNMSPAKVKKFLALVEKHPLPPVTAADLKGWSDSPTLAKVEAYWNAKYKRLIDFLNRAIELNEPIECSI